LTSTTVVPPFPVTVVADVMPLNARLGASAAACDEALVTAASNPLMPGENIEP